MSLSSGLAAPGAAALGAMCTIDVATSSKGARRSCVASRRPVRVSAQSTRSVFQIRAASVTPGTVLGTASTACATHATSPLRLR